MSFTGALLAVFIQQWAQPYLQATKGRHSPRERARIRIFHAEGLKKLHLHWVTRAVPILIQVSLFLFFSGLPIFLFDVNRTVFNVVVIWLGLCVAGYACITLMPIFYQNSPYYSPLSPFVWWCVTNMLFIVHQLLEKFVPRDSSVFLWYDTHYARSWPSSRDMQGATERFALQLSSDIDYRALLWMFKTLNDDNDFEQFFDALPSLCDLEEFVDAQRDFIKPNEKMLSHALIGMMDRTLLSDLVPEKVKQRRIIICSKALGATSLLGPRWTLRRVLLGDWHGFSRSIHFGLFVQGWKKVTHPVTAFYTQFVVAVTLASVQEQERDDRWLQLASEQLKKSTSVIQFFLEYGGDTILLPNAIFIIRRTIQTFSGSEDDHRNDILEASSKTLKLICRFDIQRTLEEHQHQFCSLWNQLVDAAQNNTHPRATPLCTMMLKIIRKLYITLHEKTDSSPTAFSTTTDDRDQVLDDARSYPSCTNDEHSHSTPVPELQLDELPRNGIHATASSMDMIPPLSPSLVPRTPPPYSTSLPSVVSAQYNSVHSRLSRTSSVHHSVASRRQSYTSGMYDPVAPGQYTFVPGLYSHSAARSYPLIPRPYSPPGPYPHVPRSYSPGPYPPVPRSYSPPGLYSPVPRLYSPPDLYSPVPRLYSPPDLYSPVPRRSYSFPGPYSQDLRSYSHSAAPTPPGAPPFVYIPQVASSRARHSRHVPTTTAETDSRHDVPAFITPFSFASEDTHMRVDAPSASTSMSSFPGSPVQIVPERALPARQERPVSPPGADLPISTPPLVTSTPYIDANGGAPGFADSSDSLGQPFGPPAMVMPETPPTPPLPTPASATGSTVAAPVPPVILSTPQELIPNPEPSFSVPPVTVLGIPIQVPPDSGSTHSTVVRFDIPETPSPVSLYSQTVPVLTSPSASSRPVSFSMPMRGGGGPVQTPPLVIKFNRYGEFSWLLYYSPHSMLYEDKLYLTALHLFEARKFLPYRPDLAARVRRCEHVEQVTSISAELADFVRRDWNDIMLSAVSKFVPYLAPRPFLD
jgi:hypothetical protein